MTLTNSRHFAAFQARALDIVTQVIEPLEDFFMVERVKAKFEAKRLHKELATKEKEMEEEKKREAAEKREENEAAESREGEEKEAKEETDEKIDVTVVPLIAELEAGESGEEMEAKALNVTQPEEKEAEVKEEKHENKEEVKKVDSRDEILHNFQAMTGIEDEGAALQQLEASGWVLNEAVNVANAKKEEEPLSMYDKVKARTNKREAEEDCVAVEGGNLLALKTLEKPLDSTQYHTLAIV